MRRRGVVWSAAQNTLVQKILKRARHDVKVTFIPGNHDEAVREHCGTLFGNIQVERDYVHVAADGKRYLLIHGDEFDQVTRHHHWVAVLGDIAYNWLVRFNALLSWVRRRLNRPGYWSLAGYAKRMVKSATSSRRTSFCGAFASARARSVMLMSSPSLTATPEWLSLFL